jgi:hypothetical protein
MTCGGQPIAGEHEFQVLQRKARSLMAEEPSVQIPAKIVRYSSELDASLIVN